MGFPKYSDRKQNQTLDIGKEQEPSFCILFFTFNSVALVPEETQNE